MRGEKREEYEEKERDKEDENNKKEYKKGEKEISQSKRSKKDLENSQNESKEIQSAIEHLADFFAMKKYIKKYILCLYTLSLLTSPLTVWAQTAGNDNVTITTSNGTIDTLA